MLYNFIDDSIIFAFLDVLKIIAKNASYMLTKNFFFRVKNLEILSLKDLDPVIFAASNLKSLNILVLIALVIFIKSKHKKERLGIL